MNELTPSQTKDIKVLAAFIGEFCAARHESQVDGEVPAELQNAFRKPLRLCVDCQALLDHAVKKRRLCPLNPKPSCKKCHIHCYSKEHRARIREIMAFSGRRMILRGRLDYLWHYLF